MHEAQALRFQPDIRALPQQLAEALRPVGQEDLSPAAAEPGGPGTEVLQRAAALTPRRRPPLFRCRQAAALGKIGRVRNDEIKAAPGKRRMLLPQVSA